MAWYLVKQRDNFTFTLPSDLPNMTRNTILLAQQENYLFILYTTFLPLHDAQ
jgi:hypothetical protein